ncbi:hypothetical protein EAH89_21610 [Roseomonas nepalensis]|uniref:Uncharacterized protein n=1 Tax=Muricoccus nepalensis TaxID=1854500 RepID=A0A502FIW0_9PROT|nr:hypothetical protein [Roseomonas nepalensis]TPG49309.1 hypothetical protein EAH89_21610 [Roseomonas nepalensis]
MSERQTLVVACAMMKACDAADARAAINPSLNAEWECFKAVMAVSARIAEDTRKRKALRTATIDLIVGLFMITRLVWMLLA